MRALVITVSLLLAWVAGGCAPPCSTDADCGEGALCINGECKQREAPPGADAGTSDAAVAGDSAAATDAARPDAARPDTGAGGDAARPDSGGAGDAFATDAAQAADAAAPDVSSGDSAGPSDGAISDAASGTDAASAGRIGDPCTDHSDCVEPFGAYCITTWPGGYCSAPCTWGGSPFECGMDAECYCEDMLGGDCLVASCYRTCWMFDECRDGYRCETADWIGFYGDEDLCYYF